MTNNSKPGSWILLLSMVGVSVVYLLAVFLPTQKAIGRLNDEARQKEAYCAQAGNLDAILKATRLELGKTHQYNKVWSDATPSQGQVVALLGRINAMSRAAGAETTRFDPEPIVRHDRVCRIPLAMGLTGPLPRIFDFVAELEGLPQSIWIENVILEKIEGVDKTSKSVSCEIKLVIFDDNSNISDQGNPTR
jgi:Tfp pilus assembly protein PilO